MSTPSPVAPVAPANGCPIQQRIAEAIASTPDRSKARNKALAAVRWVLVCATGYAALSDDLRCIVVPDISDALVFDGRDNESMKARYYSAVLRTECVPVLLP